jgi:hypothetical protein
VPKKYQPYRYTNPLGFISAAAATIISDASSYKALSRQKTKAAGLLKSSSGKDFVEHRILIMR